MKLEAFFSLFRATSAGVFPLASSPHVPITSFLFYSLHTVVPSVTTAGFRRALTAAVPAGGTGLTKYTKPFFLRRTLFNINTV